MYVGSGNGLVPDGTKPLPEPMLRIMYTVRTVTSYERHYVSDHQHDCLLNSLYRLTTKNINFALLIFFWGESTDGL